MQAPERSGVGEKFLVAVARRPQQRGKVSVVQPGQGRNKASKRTPWSPAPNDVVYLLYKPQRVGLVITCGLDVEADFAGVASAHMPGEGVEILWEDGQRSVEWSSALSSLDALIDACEHKLVSHLTKRARLEQTTGAPTRQLT